MELRLPRPSTQRTNFLLTPSIDSSRKLEKVCFIFLLWVLLPSSLSSLETQVKNGTLDTDYNGHINSSIEIVYQFFVTSADFHQDEGSHNALRAYARSDDSDLDEPVTIVVKQKRGVLSWELPNVNKKEKKEI